jgi:hypothetical protein
VCIAQDLFHVMAKKHAPIRDCARLVIQRARAVVVTHVKALPQKTGARIRIPQVGSALAIRATITDRPHFGNRKYVRVVMAARAKHCALDVIKWAESAEILMALDSAAANEKRSTNRAGVVTKGRYEFPT